MGSKDVGFKVSGPIARPKPMVLQSGSKPKSSHVPVVCQLKLNSKGSLIGPKPTAPNKGHSDPGSSRGITKLVSFICTKELFSILVQMTLASVTIELMAPASSLALLNGK